MISTDFKTEARRALSGKWGKAVLITLVYTIITGILSSIQNNISLPALKAIISIAVVVVEVPLVFGFLYSLYKLFKGEDVKVFDFFSLGFTNIVKAWDIVFNTIIKMIVPVILIIVAIVMMIIGGSNMPTITYSYDTSFAHIAVSDITGVNPLFPIGGILFFIAMIWITIRGLFFVLSNYIAFDNMDMPAKEVVEKSKSLMTGKRGKFFVLLLTFIGWAILCVLTLGIGYLWLLPYVQFSIFAFYKYLAGDNNKETEKVEATE